MVSVQTSEFWKILQAISFTCLLACGAVACVAIASLAAHSILLRPADGLESFVAVLSFSNAGLVEPVRYCVEIFNWIGVMVVAGFTLNSCYRSIQRLFSRPVSRSMVVPFPQKRLPLHNAPKKAANW